MTSALVDTAVNSSAPPVSLRQRTSTTQNDATHVRCFPHKTMAVPFRCSSNEQFCCGHVARSEKGGARGPWASMTMSHVVATALLVGGTMLPHGYACVKLHFESQASTAVTLSLRRAKFELVRRDGSRSDTLASYEVDAPIAVSIGSPIELGLRAGMCSFFVSLSLSNTARRLSRSRCARRADNWFIVLRQD